METMDPGLVIGLRKHVALTRMLGFSMCFLAPAIYVVVLVNMAFHGNHRPLLAGFHAVPWGDLRMIILSMISLALLAAGPFLAQQFWVRANQARNAADLFTNLRIGHIVHCALLESVAIFGLVLGFMVGPAAGPVCLVMLMAPPVGYLLLIPGARSRMRLLSMRASQFPGGRVPGPINIRPGDDLGAS